MKIKRTLAVASAAGILALGAAACQPYFSGATLTVTPRGQLADLAWSAATESDAGEVVSEYGIEINGAEVGRFPASGGTTCVLTGLAGGGGMTTLSVTAYGSTGEWSGTYSGDLAPMARVSTTYINTSIGAPAGSTPRCVAPTDADGDRLPNALETNTGTFQSANATGTNPNNADTDADGIRDGDEVLGTTAGLDLYAMGTRPTKKDLLFELDWFNDNLDPLTTPSTPGTCAAHSHRPTAAILTRVQTAFAATPVSNPNGTTGVNVIGDYGQGGQFTGGNLVADANGVLVGGVNDVEYKNHKAANFSAQREGYFHYVLMPHRYDTTSGSSGQAEIQGDDLIVSLQCFNSTSNVGNTIMHEVGHNLNLRHGGNVNTNYKPNYNSVMNYKYQFPGVDTTCDSVGDGTLAYSNGARAALVESALLETNGVCNGVDIDWNISGATNPAAVSVDINRSSTSQLGGTGDGLLQTLNDFNDAANLCLTCVGDGDGASPDPQADLVHEVITEQPVPPEARVVGP